MKSPQVQLAYAHKICAGRGSLQGGGGYFRDVFKVPESTSVALSWTMRSSISLKQAELGVFLGDRCRRGLVLIDALHIAEEAERIIVPGFQAFGYTPHDIKAVFITHEHFDHFGGVWWLRDTYHIPAYGSVIGWDNMAHYEIDGGSRRDQLHVQYARWQREYMAALNGGAGIKSNGTQWAAQVNDKPAMVIEDNNVTVMLANHPNQDQSVTSFDILEARKCEDGECEQENPFVAGTDAFSR
ncbi:uncharacterized protein A1O9_06847 [Exophiala aquamarina CBS 119918]|uniref:Metallo-beta-lactamase domain-containing protein n=1 Tax=Exophiala aquamarina CBS 119918 TaxID=1182545 RepID=A0A072PBL4_9EURO|nr:uncharacterized protein A1O9_06847 [Exophiala aquamarina CBS 119918]KEF56658.1 hypothetical protein A1O9_06847 [Exophiala aquamarina CBS 119918]